MESSSFSLSKYITKTRYKIKNLCFGLDRDFWEGTDHHQKSYLEDFLKAQPPSVQRGAEEFLWVMACLSRGAWAEQCRNPTARTSNTSDPIETAQVKEIQATWDGVTKESFVMSVSKVYNSCNLFFCCPGSSLATYSWWVSVSECHFRISDHWRSVSNTKQSVSHGPINGHRPWSWMWTW